MLLRRFRTDMILTASAGGLLGLTACSGNPTAPAPPDRPTNLTIVPEQRTSEGNVYSLGWTAPAGSVDRYTIEVGSSPGGSDVLTVETLDATPTYSLVTQHRGPLTIRVRARNSGGAGAPSDEVEAADLRDVIEALFFSTGALTPIHQPICQFTSFFPNVVEGFPRGTALSVLVSSTLTQAHQQAVGKLLDDFSTLADLHTNRALSDDRAYMEQAFRQNQFSGSNELVIVDVDDGQAFCGALGCGGGRLAPGATTPQFRNAFTIAQHDAAPGIIAHELGHALGLCHVPETIAGVPALMGNVSVDQLSAYELAAITSLYGSGLGPGSTRQDLVAAGLIGS